MGPLSFSCLKKSILKEERKIKMVPVKLVGLLLMCTLLHVRNSAAHNRQVAEGTVIPDRKGNRELEVTRSSLVEVKKGFNDVPAAKNEAKHTRVRGRKLKLKRVLKMNEEKVKEEALNGEVTRIPGAANFVVKCERRGKRTLIAKCKLSNRRSVNLRNDKMVGITAFSADYHVPKSHPPKNN